MIVKTECDKCFGFGFMYDSYFGIDKIVCNKCHGNGYIEYEDSEATNV